MLMAVEHSTTNGPWLLEERFHKTNALLRYSRETSGGRFAVTAQGYDGEWRSTIRSAARRAIRSVDRFGFVDPTNGGESHRYTLAADWHEQIGAGRMHAQATQSTIGSTSSRTSRTRSTPGMAISSSSSMTAACTVGSSRGRDPSS